MGLLMIVPVIDGNSTPALVLLGMGLLVSANALVGGKTSAPMGVILAFAVIFMVWESAKALAATIDQQIRVPQSAWTVTPYTTLDEALVGLQNGEVKAVIADAKDLEALMPTYPESDEGGTTYTDLRVVQPFFGDQQFIFPYTPDIPGRLSIAVPQNDVALNRPSQWVSQPVGAVTGEFALDKYLNQPRSLVLLDLKILNDLNLPHLQDIAEAFLQPARRNGEQLLVRILGAAGLYTWGEAVFGFTFGALLGLILGTLFAHSKLLERAFLPYVVASQTVPILAIAPMVVIWLGASPTSVAVIAVYITFFPVTINTLRGLTSPNPTSVELMESYAASRWTTLWKLRFPSALPYIFAALKISATASVVGAIIGELPSGIGDGLGRAILDFSSDYSAISTPKLWAAIVTASLVGVTFFLIVSAIEKVVLRRYVRSASG
jgi:NitT/TauT family transport system permease protein